MHLGPRPPAVFVRGQGSWLWDASGQRYLDLVQGWAVNTLGHAPAAIAQALTRQAGSLLQAGPGFYNDQAIALAQRLCALTGFDRVFISTSGAEANEGAIKLARKWGQVHKGGANTVISFDNSFHGRSLATMAASGKPGFDKLFAPAVPGFKKVPLNQINALRAALTPDVVAVMIEPIQGEAGVVEADHGFMQQVRALCDEHGVLLIVDEVQCGMGRCGSLLAHTQSGVEADIVTLGKGLGGGVPIGAVLAREGVCCFAPGDQGGTYHGNALVSAAALAVLDEVSVPGFMDNVQNNGDYLARGLAQVASRHGLGAVHGRGLLRAIALPAGLNATLVADAARAGRRGGDGLLINPAQPQRLRLMPALTITPSEIDHAMDLLDAALHQVCTSAL
jgi:acetylornithine/N-succinyldiaminopimelate aminotransferase